MAHSHKNTNTHVFKNFNELVHEIDITNRRRIQGYQSLPENEFESCFGSALAKWSELNRTQHFGDFRQDVEINSYSHELVILNKDSIADALLRHLLVSQSMALIPLLDLVTQLSRDLQSDFYSLYFERFYEALVKLIEAEHHNPEVLDNVFMCLACLFKFLFRPMVKDIRKIFRLISPLLSREKHRSYVNNFIAEAFSFLIRKEKDLENLFEFIFKKVNKDTALVEGVGQLLFETVRGVQHQFHSIAAKVIPVLLSCLDRIDFFDIKVETLSVMWTLMASYTNADCSKLILNSLIEKLDQLRVGWKCSADGIGHQFSGILKLLNIWINHKDGDLIEDHERLLSVVESLVCSERHLPDDGLSELLTACGHLLLAGKIDLAGHERAKLLSKIFKSGYNYAQLADFIQTILGIPLFEKDVQLHLVEYTSQMESFDDALLLLSTILEHKLPSTDKILDVLHSEPFILDFHGKQRKFLDRLMSSLDRISRKDFDRLDLSRLWAMIRCISHVRPIEVLKCLEILQRVFSNILEYVQEASKTNEESVPSCLSVLKETSVTLAYLVKSENLSLLKYLPDNLPMILLSQFPENEDSLAISGIYFSCARNDGQTEILSGKTFEMVFKHLQPNLSSPYFMIRSQTLSILCLFPLQLPTAINSNPDQKSVFQVCREVELIPASFQRFRDKTVLLNRLNWEYISSRLPAGVSEKVPLSYLIGQLHVHFEPMWKPLIELIKSYAVGMKLDDFWDVFGRLLGRAAELGHAEHLSSVDSAAVCLPASPESQMDAMFCRYSSLNAKLRSKDRPSFSGFRDHLWTAMQSFPRSCEPRSRIIVPIFFNFLENEYERSSSDVTLTRTQDLRLALDDNDVTVVDDSETLAGKSGDGTDEQPMETEETDGKQAHKSTSKRGVGRRALDRVLVTHLSVFALFNDVKSLYQGQRLFDLYLELLKHQSPAVQKAAFECLMPYKLKFLTPYRENFERLISEKTFKNEMILFSINSDSQVVNEEHRGDLIPILMRILYGKMKLKVGKEAGGRSQGHTRKNVILAFLANSRPEEIKHFFQLLFQPFQLFFADEELCSKVKEIKSSVDVSRSIPLRKLQGVLTSIEMIFDKLSNIVDLYLPRILQLLVGLGAYCSALLSKRTEIAPKSVSLIKSIRLSVLTRIDEFFDHFDKYPWRVDEIDALFEAVVWPQMKNLSLDDSEKDSAPFVFPTGLLRLCLTWSSNRRYFYLLVKCIRDPCQLDMIPLACAFKLLEMENFEKTSKDIVMGIVENLLEEETPEIEETDRVVPLDPGSMWKVSIVENVSYGTQLVLLFAPFVLNYLVTIIENLAADSTNSRKVPMPRQEIRILKNLSIHMTDAVQCRKAVGLSLSILTRRRNLGSETEEDLLTSVRDMITKIEEIDRPLELMTMIWQLSDSLTLSSSRILLCSILSLLAQKDPTLEETASIACKINSWDQSRLDEPDYDLRAVGYQEAGAVLSRPEFDVNFLLMIVHNCCHFVARPNDNCSSCLDKVISKLADLDPKADVFQEVVVRHMLPLVQAKLRVKEKILRTVFIEKLRTMVLRFSSCSHFVSLNCLVNDSDKDCDFFLNLIHIQVHRQHRALLDLTEFLSRRTMPASVLSSYLLPLVMAFLRNDDEYLSQHVLRDFAIKALGAIARRLPWEKYHTLLLSCLRCLLIGKQSLKLNIRILVAVLDNFHFDLKHSQFQSETPQQPDKVENDTKDKNVGLDEDENAEEMEVEVDDHVTSASDDLHIGETSTLDVCPAGRATYIHRVVVLKILPQLQKCLAEKTKSDDQHKMAKTEKIAEGIEILRVPLAVAMIKLLKVLPNEELQKNLSGIVLKVIRFLQSRAEDIRRVSYDTLRKIITSLGPLYFRHIVTELKSLLTRGYQLHVLCYAIWSILDECLKQNQQNLAENRKAFLMPGDIDSSVSILTEIFKMELFGKIAEEKEVEEITGKLMEAKKSRSTESYAILTLFVSQDAFALLIASLKTELENTKSHKMVNTVSNVLTQILGNVLENKELKIPFLMELIFAISSNALLEFASANSSRSDLLGRDPRLKPVSCLILKAAPPRGGVKPKTDSKANFHVLIEFSFQLLHRLMNQGFLVAAEKFHLQLVDPFVKILTESLSSKHVKVISSALKCLSKVFELPVPSLTKHSKSIFGHLFSLLKSYAVVGTGQGPNEDLVSWCFKTITALIRHQTNIPIATEHLHTLLLYAEQDLNDYTRQATAFPILRAIIARKLKAKELPSIMIHLEEMSIRENPDVQAKCRKVIASYVISYPMSDKELEKHVDFFVTQLLCDFTYGRQGAIEMLKEFFAKFPQNILNRWKFKFFLPLLQSAIEFKDGREETLTLLRQFLARLDGDMRDELTTQCFVMMKSDNPGILVSGAVAVSCIVEVEVQSFKRHLSTVFPLIEAQISPEKTHLLNDVLYYFFDLLFKIFTECDVVRDSKWTPTLNKLWKCTESHLRHSSSVIQLKANQLFLKLFDSWTPSELLEESKGKKKKEYLELDTDETLFELSGAFIQQFSTPDINHELASTVICNLLFLGKILLLRPSAAEKSDERPRASFRWLVRRLCNEVKEEVRNRKKESLVKRESVFSWIEGISLQVNYPLIVPYLQFLLKPLIREQTDPETDADLKQEVERILGAIEKRSTDEGNDSFETIARLLNKKMQQLKQSRKDVRAAEAVTDPEKFAKRKTKKNLVKKELRKRKMKEKKFPKNPIKRRKLTNGSQF